MLVGMHVALTFVFHVADVQICLQVPFLEAHSLLLCHHL